jgi:hypothetical protein
MLKIPQKYNNDNDDNNNYNLNELNSYLNKININKYKLENIDVNKIPIIIVDEYKKIKIKFVNPKYSPISEFFKVKNTKHYYLLYSIIVNLCYKNICLFGGALRSILANEQINDLDFKNMSNNYIDIYEIHIIIYILNKLIYKKNINNEYINNNKNLYKFIYEHNIKIDIIDYDITNYDFYENSLYLDNKLQINTFSNYNPNNNLILYLIKILIINNNNEYNNMLFNIINDINIKIEEYCLLLKLYLQIINNNYIINNILEMLGIKYLCFLEIAYYINKKSLRLSHIYCNYYCNPTNHILYIEDNIFLTTNISKMVYVRIPKFRQRNYKIIYSNCCHENCLYMFIKLIDYYRRNKYMVKFYSFLEVYYNNSKENIFIKKILDKNYRNVEKYDNFKFTINTYDLCDHIDSKKYKNIIDNNTTIFSKYKKKKNLIYNLN